MKQCTAVALFKKTDFPRVELINFAINTKDGYIIDFPALYGPYYDFTELYSALLRTLKTNNYYVKSWTDFNTTWNNIMFIDIENPGKAAQYSYKMEV